MVEGLGPKLRFAEFAGQPFQCRAPISTLARVQKGQQLPTELKQGNAGYPHFNGGQSPSGFALEANQPANTIIVSEGGNSCGYVQFIREPFWAGGHCYALQPRGDVDAQFLFQALKRKEHDIMRLRVGSGLPNIQKSDIEAFLIEMPQTAAEQRKIAECLTSLDELIVAEGRKLEALRAFKKGLMQNLFPREGETTPRLRFPEFRTAGQWEEKPLKAICERIMDGTHFSPKSQDGPRPYLTSKNIRQGALDLSSVSYISEEEHREIFKRCPVRKDDVLLTKDGANTGNSTLNTLECEFSLLSSVAVLRGHAAYVDQRFLYQTIASERTQANIVNSMSGQAITRITLEKLGGYVVPLPDLAEQQRIASCLGSLDTLITEQSKKLATLKTHKQGLMQGLFPSPESKDACPEMEPL